MWGPDHIMLYNDSYSPIAGDRHPAVLGQPVAAAFPELWGWNRPILEAGMQGEIISHSSQPILFHRAWGAETLILDLFYTPVYQDDGRVGGVMCTIIDNSKRVEAERAAGGARDRTAAHHRCGADADLLSRPQLRLPVRE